MWQQLCSYAYIPADEKIPSKIETVMASLTQVALSQNMQKMVGKKVVMFPSIYLLMNCNSELQTNAFICNLIRWKGCRTAAAISL